MDVDPGPLGRDEVSRLVHEDEHAEDDDQGQYGHQHADLTLCSAASRAQRSAARTASTSWRGPARVRVEHRARSISLIRPNGTAPGEEGGDRHLVGRVEHGRRGPAGAARPRCRRRARRNTSVPNRLEGERPGGDRIEAADAGVGQPVRMGERVEDRQLHRREPELRDARCHRRTRRRRARCSAGGPPPRARRTDSPNRWWASISSSALLASVALSTVILLPMRQVGCCSASSTVASRTRSAAHSRNGPPDAVRMRRPSAAVPAGDALEHGAVLRVDRHDLAAAGAGRLGHQRRRP